MTSISQQINRAFTQVGVNAVTIYPFWGTVRISRKEYADYLGTRRTTFKAELIEKGKQMESRASNPWTALNDLHGFVQAGGRN